MSDETQIAVVKPQPIRDIMELRALADQRRSVRVGDKIYPAAWLLNCSAYWVDNLLRWGSILPHKPKRRRLWNWVEKRWEKEGGAQ